MRARPPARPPIYQPARPPAPPSLLLFCCVCCCRRCRRLPGKSATPPAPAPTARPHTGAVMCTYRRAGGAGARPGRVRRRARGSVSQRAAACAAEACVGPPSLKVVPLLPNTSPPPPPAPAASACPPPEAGHPPPPPPPQPLSRPPPPLPRTPSARPLLRSVPAVGSSGVLTSRWGGRGGSSVGGTGCVAPGNPCPHPCSSFPPAAFLDESGRRGGLALLPWPLPPLSPPPLPHNGRGMSTAANFLYPRSPPLPPLLLSPPGAGGSDGRGRWLRQRRR